MAWYSFITEPLGITQSEAPGTVEGNKSRAGAAEGYSEEKTSFTSKSPETGNIPTTISGSELSSAERTRILERISTYRDNPPLEVGLTHEQAERMRNTPLEVGLTHEQAVRMRNVPITAMASPGGTIISDLPDAVLLTARDAAKNLRVEIDPTHYNVTAMQEKGAPTVAASGQVASSEIKI